MGGLLRTASFALCFLGMATSGLGRPWNQKESPIEAVISPDGTFDVYNVSDLDLVAVFGTYEYTSPVSGKVVVSEWEKFMVSPLVQPMKPVRPGECFTFHRTLHPSGLEYVKRRNVTATGALFAGGITWGPMGQYLKATLASQLSNAYAQLLEVRARLTKCSKSEAAALLRSPDPIVVVGRDTRLVHVTLQRMLFEDKDFEQLDPQYKEKIDHLIRTLESYLTE